MGEKKANATTWQASVQMCLKKIDMMRVDQVGVFNNLSGAKFYIHSLN